MEHFTNPQPHQNKEESIGVWSRTRAIEKLKEALKHPDSPLGERINRAHALITLLTERITKENRPKEEVEPEIQEVHASLQDQLEKGEQAANEEKYGSTEQA